MSALGYCQFGYLLSVRYNYKPGYKLCDQLQFKCSHWLKYYFLSECCNFNPWKESNLQQVTRFIIRLKSDKRDLELTIWELQKHKKQKYEINSNFANSRSSGFWAGWTQLQSLCFVNLSWNRIITGLKKKQTVAFSLKVLKTNMRANEHRL